MNYPNLFIVGAPRCGTTSLHYYLGQHPDIFMSHAKEPYYFLTDLPHRDRFSRTAYFDLFRDPGDVRYAGEASVLYLRSETAATAIHAFCPRARIIIMLRNPAELLHSLHCHCLRTANEDIFDFERALAAEPERERGLRIPRTAYFPTGLCYRQMVDFVPQVRRYLDTFGQASVRIILFDDFKKATLEVYRDLLAWLGVAGEFRPNLTPQNASTPLPNLFIQRQLRRNRFLRGIRRGLQALVPDPATRLKIQAAIGRRTQRQPNPRMDPELRRRLLEEMRPDIDALGELVGIDLSVWYRR